MTYKLDIAALVKDTSNKNWGEVRERVRKEVDKVMKDKFSKATLTDSQKEKMREMFEERIFGILLAVSSIILHQK